MSKLKDLGAFPAMTPEAGGYSEGMTLRQYYAGQAMVGLMRDFKMSEHDTAKYSVLYADALIAELEKE